MSKRVERVSIVDDLTEGVEKARDLQISTRIDQDTNQFLEDSANITTENEIIKAKEKRKRGERYSPAKVTKSFEAYRAIEMISEFAKRYRLETMDDVDHHMREMMDLYDHLKVLKGKGEMSEVMAKLRAALRD